MRTIPDRIRWILDHRRLSQSGLSKKANLARSTVDSILERLSTDPDPDVGLASLIAIAEAGEVRLGWLVTGEGSPVASGPGDPCAHHFADLDRWQELLERAKILAPEIPQEAWQRLAEAYYPARDTPPTAALLIEIAKALMKAEPLVHP